MCMVGTSDRCDVGKAQDEVAKHFLPVERKMGSPLSKSKKRGRKTWTLLILHALSVFILETDLSYIGVKYPEINSGACAWS